MTDSRDHLRVVALVVAHDRSSLLAEALDAIAAQTASPDRVIVIDNASSDGSADLAQGHPIVTDVVRLTRNTGGAGGFAVGLATAFADPDVDAVWLMDDDTVPTPTALEQLVAASIMTGRPPVLGSRVIWVDGSDHPMNRPRRRPGTRRTRWEPELVPVRSSSFVSMLVDGEAARATRLPIADYFIWNDDFEYSMRLLRHRVGFSVPASVVVHKTARLVSTDADPGERFFYEVRNKLWLLRFSTGLSLGERALYAAATARRWFRTWRRSTDRSTLRSAAIRGWRAGVRERPLSNRDALSGLGPGFDSVVAFEEAAAGRR